MNTLLSQLVTFPGVYRGSGDGPESGPFHARLEVRAVVGGRAAVLDYEAVDSDRVVHVDHVMLSEDERGRPELHVVSDELPGIVNFTQSEPGVFQAFEPIKAKLVLEATDDGAVSYAWWWSRDDGPARAQSQALLHRTP